MKALVRCPSCGEEITPVEIVYGYPTAEAMEAARRRELQLGGCIVGGDDPELACPRCEAPIHASP